jgi:hypothetical protein
MIPKSGKVITCGVAPAEATTIENVVLAVFGSVPSDETVSVTDVVPAVVGVPVITPVAEFRTKPAGSDPEV